MSIPWVQRPSFDLKLCGGIVKLEDRPLLMGIVNVTPDSFSDGGRRFFPGDAITGAEQMARCGVDIIDVGGESTRPGSEAVNAEEEMRRILPVVKELAGVQKLNVSIDTQKAVVAQAALEAGAVMVNDVSALRTDPKMAKLVSEAGCYVCLMHMLGTPKTMQNVPHYDGDVVSIVKSWLAERMRLAERAGVSRDRMIIDPGFGFGKLPEHNLELTRRVHEFHALGVPLMIGFSRKSTIGIVLDAPVDGRLYGSLAAAAVALMAGVHILRVHDVKPTSDVIKISEAIRKGICFRN